MKTLTYYTDSGALMIEPKPGDGRYYPGFSLQILTRDNLKSRFGVSSPRVHLNPADMAEMVYHATHGLPETTWYIDRDHSLRNQGSGVMRRVQVIVRQEGTKRHSSLTIGEYDHSAKSWRSCSHTFSPATIQLLSDMLPLMVMHVLDGFPIHSVSADLDSKMIAPEANTLCESKSNSDSTTNTHVLPDMVSSLSN